MPGLVNAHTHSPENLARGRSERTRLPEWREAIWHSAVIAIGSTWYGKGSFAGARWT
jgi:cytosine/adenosine deaminase-related metal-dependent hydrolase